MDLPDFSREALVELGGFTAVREARDIFQAGGVLDVRWESPVLSGELEVRGQLYSTSLNLRSLTFPQTQCQCSAGKRGQVCSHALALCMAILKKSQNPTPKINAKASERTGAVTSTTERVDKPVQPDESRPRTIKIDSEGELLRIRLILPPNFEQAAKRNAIMVKVEFIRGREQVIPEKLYKGIGYDLPEQDHSVVALLESFGGGRLHGLVQLKCDQLKKIISGWGETPFIYASADAFQPITQAQWKTEYIPKLESAPKPVVTPSIRRSHGILPPAKRVAPPRIQLPDNWMVIDGSPHFLAVMLRDRDYPLYRRAVDLLRASGFRNEPSNGKWWLRDQHKVLNFLASKKAEVDHVFDPGYTDNYHEKMKEVGSLEINVEIQSLQDRQRVHLSLSASGLDETAVRLALASGKFYILQPDKIYLIDPDKLNKFHEATKALSGEIQPVLTGGFEVTLNSPQLIDAERILEDLDDNIALPEDWKERSRALKDIGKLEDPPIDTALRSALRGYQLVGVAWLWHLYRNQLGGVLADEMGLGKTIQAIGLLSCLKKEGLLDKPALIIAPASLLTNWAKEIAKWGSGLRAYIHHRESRLTSAEEVLEKDVIITSYSTLRNDLSLFLEDEFSTIIADEAQHVKNRRTKSARALRQLVAPSRYILTGTPIENSVEDLRSIFDFALPGYLGRKDTGLKGEDKSWAEKRILEKAAPYILRRSKKLVAPELPEKIEQVLWCDLSPEQRKIYNNFRESSERALIDMEASGASENRIRFAVLTELLRLRQICADPGMLDPGFEIDFGSKLRAFREILEEALDGGHRILVFSQFVKLLKRLAEWLEEKGHRYSYIDGKTRDRLGVCDEFNNDSGIPICLISLKAGGTGLNLTGADTVVHFDPWWNPAVEDQATDRAHRIGQTRTVTSYKLITVGTVEEKVMALQEKKASLLRDLLDESAVHSSQVDLATLKDLLRTNG